VSDETTPASTQTAAADRQAGGIDPARLAGTIVTWGKELGFQQVGITDTDLGRSEARLQRWLDDGRHGTMDYMQRHGTKRSRPSELVAGTRSVISVRMDYLPQSHEDIKRALLDPERAFISRYALGRDYHKLLRQRLQHLAERIRARVGPFGYRVFTDSAPVMEKPLAQKAGLGWIGKHTNLISRRSGSWFFLGEIYTDLELPPSTPGEDHCGRCTACIRACPTGAIVAPYQLDARLCISYLTIEHRGSIPERLREPIGNRIFGCDDCQLVCPWNRFARKTGEPDLLPRRGLDRATLRSLFAWDEVRFLARTEGSAIRRIGHALWLRNLAVALGNASPTEATRQALTTRIDHPDALVREHVRWALARQRRGSDQPSRTAPS